MTTATEAARTLPGSHLPAGADVLPLLDARQVGHLRHIQNLSNQLDGDWAHMGGLETGQEFFSALRYQLAWMAYTLAVAHFHRLPGAPGVFLQPFANVMRKMLRYDVWSYWEHTSKSSRVLDPDLETLREGWRDPVVKENIMYSGHVHAMAGLFGILFDDDRYEREGGLTFEFRPVFASGAEDYVYDFTSLNETIYWQMVENGFLGVACEPNRIFLICNQFPMLGFRFHDVRKGTAYAEEVTKAHEAAWRRKGWVTKDNSFVFFYSIRRGQLEGVHNALPATLMNSWNSDFVRGLYPLQVAHEFVEPEPGMLLPRPRTIDGDPLERFVEEDQAVGLSAIWLSEMGDTPRLEALLRYVDAYQNPTWEKGGLYYPRNDAFYDERGHWVFVDPLIGNALIAFSRLNPSDGLRQIYAEPWGAEHFAEPNLSGVSAYADVLRAGYLEDAKALVVTVQADAGARDVELRFGNVHRGSGRWILERDGERVASGDRAVIEGNGADVERADDDQVKLRLPIRKPTDLTLWVDR